MKNLKTTRFGLVLALAILILITFQSVAVAQGDRVAAIRAITEDRPTQEQPQEPAQAGTYDLSWHTIDGGGHTWSAGRDGPAGRLYALGDTPGRLYALGGTAGQPDAGNLTGGGYDLAGGFWAGGAARCDHVEILDVHAEIDGCTAHLSATLSGAEPFYPRWDMGDGTILLDPAPTHTYSTSGSYTVTLDVWNCNAEGYDREDFPVTVDCGWRVHLPVVFKGYH